MGDLIHRNNASKDKIIASNVLMGQGNNKTDTVEKRIRDLEESGGGGGSDVEVTPLLHEGVHIADIKVNGEKSELYAPEGGGTGTITDVEVNGVSVVTEGVANIDLSGKQNVLTAGTNISISGDVISATDTTYNDVVGATSEADGVHGLMPAPTSSDLDKAVRGDGTWGYAGAIDDVQVNGQSVVENKVASFNNYVELTQADYDALPSSKLTDGVLYCIKDSGIDAHDRFCPIIYSYNEREVGVWLDGKPLYQKTVHIDTLNDSTQTYQYVQYQHGIANIDNIANYEGRIFWKQIDNHQVHINDRLSLFQGDNGTRDITNAFRIINGNFGSSISIEVNRDVIMVSCGTDRTALSLDCTIWYTKTTDVAGSGTWGTDGIPMHHYSKSEHIVGTWLDGRTLYEKTIIHGVTNNVSEPLIVLDSTIKNTVNSYVVYIEGIVGIGQLNNNPNGYTLDGSIYPITPNHFYYTYQNPSMTSDNVPPVIYADKNGINWRKLETEDANMCIVTVRYVKI